MFLEKAEVCRSYALPETVAALTYLQRCHTWGHRFHVQETAFNMRLVIFYLKHICLGLFWRWKKEEMNEYTAVYLSLERRMD